MNKIRRPCPFCHTKELKFCLFEETQSYYCYRCREWGWIRNLPKDIKTSLTLRNSTLSPQKFTLHPNMDARRDTLNLPDGYKLIKPLSPGWKYLSQRRIHCHPLKPFVGEARNYLVFPIYKQGELVYYIKRKIYGKGIRYDAAPVNGSEFVFTPYQMGRDNQNLILCEGIFDCLKVYQQTKHPAIALLGKSAGSSKISNILGYSSKQGKIYILLDPDDLDTDVIGAAVKLRDRLKNFRKVYIIRYKGNRDPGDMDQDSLLTLTALVG